MSIQPPLQDAPKYPFTSMVAVGAIVISLNWWTGGNLMERLVVPDSMPSKPWTLLTSTLPHVSVIHLLFNLGWWWMLGSRVEHVWGGPKAFAIFALLAAISSAAQHALSGSGVGLSGVVYGLCTFLWVAQDRVPGLERIVTKQTLNLFAVWFVICVVLTVTDVMQIGNVAHGAGAVAGWLLGKCIVSQRRPAWVAGLVATTALVAMLATVARPWVNFSPAIRDIRYRGASELNAGHYEQAAKFLEAAAKESPSDSGSFVNLGTAYMHLDRDHEALQMYRRALELDPSRQDNLATVMVWLLEREASEASMQGDLDLTRTLAEEILRLKPDHEYAKELLAWVRKAARANPDPVSTEPR